MLFTVASLGSIPGRGFDHIKCGHSGHSIPEHEEDRLWPSQLFMAKLKFQDISRLFITFSRRFHGHSPKRPPSTQRHNWALQQRALLAVGRTEKVLEVLLSFGPSQSVLGVLRRGSQQAGF